MDAGVGAVMCSYNRVNGTWACEQPQTLSDLKNGMGFQVITPSVCLIFIISQYIIGLGYV